MHTKPVVEQVLKEDVLFTAEVAQMLGISSSAVNNMIYRKKLIPIRSTSGAHLFYRGDIEDIINGKVSMPYLKPKEIIGHNITHKCIDYLDTLPSESFVAVVGVSIYAYEFDAVRDGYYTPEEDCYQQDSRLVATKSPSFVLHYESGSELWLKGLNCGYGGTGPNGSIAVLTGKLGVPQDLAEFVYSYSVVKYSRMDDGTWIVDTHEGSPCDANRNPHIDYYVSEGHLIVGITVDPNEKEVDWRRDYFPYMAPFLAPQPSASIKSREQAIATGQVEYYSSGRKKVYQVVLTGSAGNEIWLDIPLDENTRFSKQSNLVSLFAELGLPVIQDPKPEISDYFTRLLTKKLFVRQHNSAPNKGQSE